MDPQATIIALLKETQQALKQAGTVEQLRDVRELAGTALGLAQRGRKAAPGLLQQAVCLTIEVERQLGLALRGTDLPKASLGNQHSSKKLDRSGEPTSPKSLRDLRISKEISSRSQLFAIVGPEHFQVWTADLSQQGKCPSLKSAYLFARQWTQGKSNRKTTLPARPKATSDDPLDDAAGHLKLVDNLLRDLYVGDTSKFTPAKGRLLKRYVNEMGQFMLKMKTDRSGGDA